MDFPERGKKDWKLNSSISSSQSKNLIFPVLSCIMHVRGYTHQASAGDNISKRKTSGAFAEKGTSYTHSRAGHAGVTLFVHAFRAHNFAPVLYASPALFLGRQRAGKVCQFVQANARGKSRKSTLIEKRTSLHITSSENDIHASLLNNKSPMQTEAPMFLSTGFAPNETAALTCLSRTEWKTSH